MWEITMNTEESSISELITASRDGFRALIAGLEELYKEKMDMIQTTGSKSEQQIETDVNFVLALSDINQKYQSVLAQANSLFDSTNKLLDRKLKAAEPKKTAPKKAEPKKAAAPKKVKKK